MPRNKYKRKIGSISEDEISKIERDKGGTPDTGLSIEDLSRVTGGFSLGGFFNGIGELFSGGD
jgi:hypothetical protein